MKHFGEVSLLRSISMKRSLMILLIGFLYLGVQNCFAINQCDNQKYNTLLNQFSSGHIERIEMIYFPENILTRIGVNPERLEQNYQYKLVIKRTADKKQYNDFYHALKGEKIAPWAKRYGLPLGDVRWGCAFYNNKNEKVASIYLCRLGWFGRKGGFIDNQSVAFGRPLLGSSR